MEANKPVIQNPNELLPIEVDLFKSFSPLKQQFIMAKKAVLVTDLEAADAITSIYDLIVKSNIMLGHTRKVGESDGTMEEITAEAVYQIINTRHNQLTTAELEIIFFKGTIGEYGEFFGINVATIAGWIRSFYNDRTRINTMLEWNNLIHLATAKTQELSEKQKHQIVADGILKFWSENKADYEKHKDKFKLHVPVYAFAFYETLKWMGLINFSKERKTQIYARAKTKYQNELSRAIRDPKINFKKTDYDAIMGALNANIAFKHVVQCEAFRDYISDIYDTDEDLNSIISEKI